ncbi:hypothetical protein BM221_002493 [Beauveria bassiana]|uniref:Uncharacterized protein n=1 Tax=Beauveria bassiana TaxID=176275 RepID=A0A2N6NYQ1_BEABA|nr:hypothetical protein BM221_002493 [Beauveria bassiana]
MSGAQAEAAVRTGQDEYRAKRYKHALAHFTRAMLSCRCNRGMKRDRCSCKNFEAVVDKGGSIFHEAMYTCSCSVGKMFNKCDNPVHIKALDYRAATFESMKELDRAKRDAEWILELAPRLPDRTLMSRDFASLWKDLDFTGSSTPRRPPRIDFLKKLVAGAGRDVRRLVIEEQNHRFQLSQAKLFVLLQGAVRLEHLELSCPDHTLRIPPTAGVCKTLKTLSLRLFAAEPKKSAIGLDYIPACAYPFELLNPVAEAIETLHLSGLPMSWFREQDVPCMPRLKYLHLQMRTGSTALFPILHMGSKTPALEQLWLQDTLPDRSSDWEYQWSKIWPNFKALIVAGSNSSTAARFSISLVIRLLSSLNHGHELEYIDLDLPWSPNPDAVAIEPLTLEPGPAIQRVWNMAGTVLDPESNWQNEYRSLKAIRLANAVLNPESLQQVAQRQAAAGQLHTLDLVFPPESLATPAGAVSSAHLAKYEWLAGSPGIRCMSISQFRFRPFPRTSDDLPLPAFLATFPKLETLEIRSEHYDEAEMCSVISAIIKETKTLKLIYQNQIRGALMDKLGTAAAKHGVKVAFGERPRQLRGLGEHLHNAGGAEAVQHHVLEVFYPVAVLVVELPEAATVRVALLDEVLARVDKLAALDVLDVLLLGHFAEKNFGHGRAQHDAGGVLHLGNLGNVLVGVRVVNLVERNDGGEFLVDEGVDDALNGCVGPLLERLLESDAVKRAVDNGHRGAVARELELQRLGGRGLDGDVAPAEGAPFLQQVAEDPGDHLAAQPGNVDRGVVAARFLALGVDGTRRVDDVDQRVGMPQIIEELVSEALALVGARHQPSHVEQLNRHRAPTRDARAVVGLAPVRDLEARAGAVYL